MATARNRKGWTQLDFAIKAHVSPSSVSRWERGFPPPVRELVRLAGVLEIDPSELVEEPPETERDAAILAKLAEIEKLLRALSPTAQNGERKRKR